jgi:hypothetical protein
MNINNKNRTGTLSVPQQWSGIINLARQGWGYLPGASGGAGAAVPRFVYAQGLSLEIGSVKGFNGLGRGLGIHLHESETPWPAGFPVVDQTDAADSPMLAE